MRGSAGAIPGVGAMRAFMGGHNAAPMTLRAFMGAVPHHVFRGNRYDRASGLIFAPAVSPREDQVVSGLRAGNGLTELSMQFDDGEGDGFDGPTNDQFDITESVLMVVVFQTRAGSPLVTRSLAGKRTASPVAGWEWQLTTVGKLAFFLGSATAQIGANDDYSDNAWHVAAWQYKAGTNTLCIASELGQDQTVAVSGTTASATVAGIGAQRLLAAAVDVPLAVFYRGSAVNKDVVAVCKRLSGHIS